MVEGKSWNDEGRTDNRTWWPMYNTNGWWWTLKQQKCLFWIWQTTSNVKGIYANKYIHVLCYSTIINMVRNSFSYNVHGHVSGGRLRNCYSMWFEIDKLRGKLNLRLDMKPMTNMQLRETSPVTGNIFVGTFKTYIFIYIYWIQWWNGTQPVYCERLPHVHR